MNTKIIKVKNIPLYSRFSFTLGAQILISIVFCLLSLFIFLKLSEDVFRKEVISFDSGIMDYLFSFRSPNLTKFMMDITFFGGSLFLFCASSLTAFYLYTKRRKDSFIFIGIIYTAVILNLILKYFFARPRPDLMPLIHESYYSYPSGHAMNSFIFYTAIAYFIFRSTKNARLGIILLSIFVFLIFGIGISRVYLGVHYPSDVLAGYVVGFVWLMAAIIFEKTIIFERLYRSTNKKI